MTREKAKEWIVKLISAMKEETSGMWADPQYKDEVYEALDEAIKALSVEPQIAEWILGGYDDMYYVCSKCNAKVSDYSFKPRFKYCPNCGAKIKGDES